MKALILYRFKSEHERLVIEFDHEYESRTGRKLQHVDLNTIEGAQMAKLYDITDYPAVIATTNDGALLQLWQGSILPLINEVMFYDHNE